jgi:AcrR family transcriptional regulator
MIKLNGYVFMHAATRITQSVKTLDTASAQTTQQKILAAAQREFCEKGFDGARMRSIALRAGVNKALLHYYFRSKEILFEITLKRVVELLWTKVQTELATHAQGNLRALIQAIVSAYITTFVSNPDFPRFVIREFSQASPTLLGVLKEIVSSMSIAPQTIFSIYAKEMKKGGIRRMEPVHFMINLMGMCAATFLVKTVVEEISKNSGHGIRYNNDFYKTRIKAITEMACDGIFIEKPTCSRAGKKL